MPKPKTGADLQQIVYALQWMRTALQNFAVLIHPLQEFLEIVYEENGGRTKRKAARGSLATLGRIDVHDKAFEDCRHALAHQVALSRRDYEKRLCVYTDASNSVWSAIVSQVPVGDINLPHEKKRHEPLSFLSGLFDPTQLC